MSTEDLDPNNDLGISQEPAAEPAETAQDEAEPAPAPETAPETEPAPDPVAEAAKVAAAAEVAEELKEAEEASKNEPIPPDAGIYGEFDPSLEVEPAEDEGFPEPGTGSVRHYKTGILAGPASSQHSQHSAEHKLDHKA